MQQQGRGAAAARQQGGGVGQGDRIGLLFDAVAGSLTVYQNERRLGVMRQPLLGAQEGGGAYRWAVCMQQGRHGGVAAAEAEQSVRIEAAPVNSVFPPTPSSPMLVTVVHPARPDSDSGLSIYGCG